MERFLCGEVSFSEPPCELDPKKLKDKIVLKCHIANEYIPLPKFNSSPLKFSTFPIGKDHLPTTIFQGRAVKLRGCKVGGLLNLTSLSLHLVDGYLVIKGFGRITSTNLKETQRIYSHSMATLIKLHRKICRCYAFETARGWCFPTHCGNGPGSTGPTGAVLVGWKCLSWNGLGLVSCWDDCFWSNSFATSHEFWAPKRWVNSKGNGTPYFRKIQLDEIL